MEYMQDKAKQEILEAIGILATDVSGLKADRREILEAVGLLAEQVEDIRTDVSTLKSDVSGLKKDMTTVKATMVTKSYLDDKLADFWGKTVQFVRAEDAKIWVKLA
jgi:hypothetical protein